MSRPASLSGTLRGHEQHGNLRRRRQGSLMVHEQARVPVASQTRSEPPEFEIKQSLGGATAGTVWNANHTFTSVMHGRSSTCPQTILELGSGTGFLAMQLAAADGRRRVIATDQPCHMRTIKYNVNRNQLRHAVSCVAWDWNAAEPPALDWPRITHCVASEVVYYDETPDAAMALAKTLATVFARCRASIEVLLLLRVRTLMQSTDADGRPSSVSSTLAPSDTYDARSAVFHFIETALPCVGLLAALLPLDNEGIGQSARGLRLYQIHKQASYEVTRSEPATAPILKDVESQRALGSSLHTAWLRQQMVAGHREPPRPALAHAPPGVGAACWRCEYELMPACGSAEIPPQRLWKLLTAAGPLAEGWLAAGVVWRGWRLGGGFFGVNQLVLVANSDGRLSTSDVLDRLCASEHVQTGRLLGLQWQSADSFATCAAIARPGVPVAALSFRSSLSTSHASHLLCHGYTVCDHFLTAAEISALALLAEQSLTAHAGGHDDHIHWRVCEPRVARSDVATWVTEGTRPATDAAFRSCVLPMLARLEGDLQLFLQLRGERELQLASYSAGGSGYKPHTDALPESDVDGSQRKITAIVYANRAWAEADGGALRLWLTDNDGAASIDIEPLGGRLLLFFSGCMRHRVMPTQAGRLALTAWYH